MSFIGKLIPLVKNGMTKSPKSQPLPEKVPLMPSQKLRQGASDIHDTNLVEHEVHTLRERLKDLKNPDTGPKEAKERLTENGIENLSYFAPSHPLVSEAKAAVAASKNGCLAMSASKLPALSKIGCTEAMCPYCFTVLPAFPARATKCKNCGSKYSVKTRPIDGKKVILKVSELEGLEQEWVKDYEIKQIRRKLESTIWDERIALAQATESDPDPSIEDTARHIFSSNQIDRSNLSEVVSRLLPGSAPEFLLKVEIRIWQLQIRSISAKT